MKNAKLPMQEDIEYDAMVVKMAAQALAQKLVAQKIVYIQRDTNGKEKEHEK